MLNPPALPSNDSGNGHVPLLLVLTLEEIWRARNFSLHHNCHWDISASIRLVHSRYFEYTAISAPPIVPQHPPCVQAWCPPPLGSIKINVDAAISTSQAAIAVVARDHRGVPIKIWVRLTKKTSPVQAETEALLWAGQLAKVEKWSHVIFEGDAKICFDAINSPSNPPPWCIHTPLLNILALVECFVSCTFVWVSRTCNGVAHHVASFSLLSRSAFFFFLDNLPPLFTAFM